MDANMNIYLEKIPDDVIEAVREADAQHPDDIKEAVRQAIFAVRDLPGYLDFSRSLVDKAIQELIYDARHKADVAMKREAGYYGKPGKTYGLGASVAKVYSSVYAYRIAGTTLGLLRGEQLPSIAASEDRIAEGHRFNAELCRWLRTVTPDDKTVQESVSEKKLRQTFNRLYKKFEEAA